jgi:carboxyl-terminal processing protease
MLAAAVFTAGNLASYLGLVDLGPFITPGNPVARGAADPAQEAEAAQLAARLAEVARYLDTEALATFDQAAIDTNTQSAVRALLEASGDRYAIYYTPEEYAAYLETQNGAYSGIGILFTLANNKVTVLQAYDGSPAQDAGIEPGDVLLAVDGERKEWTLTEATQAIRRGDGEQVTLVWDRDGTERTTELTLREVNIPAVTTELIDGDLGYVYLRRFTAQSAAELRTAIEDFEAQGAHGIILDLRNNPGGLLNQAVAITSLFVEQGAVVQIETSRATEVRQVDGAVATNLPLVVLVNGSSASASELVSAALQDHGRATIIGETTYGKGTVQDLRTLSFGGALRYTIAHYLSPTGRTIDGIGVTPDIPVPTPEPSEDPEDLAEPADKADPQRDAAVLALREITALIPKAP